MNKPETYRHLKTINVDDILNFVLSKNINWNHKFNSLYGRKNDFIDFSSYPIVDDFLSEDIFLYEEFLELMSEVVSTCYQNYGPGRFSRIQIAKMSSNSKVIPHKDHGLFFWWSHRIHLPLKTNEKIIFSVDGLEKNIKVGEMVEINNKKIHTVKNNNKVPFERIHAIFDYMPEEYYRIYLNVKNEIF